MALNNSRARSLHAKPSKEAAKQLARVITALMLLVDILAIAFLVITPGNAVLRIVLGIVVLGATGELIRNANKLEGGYGLYLAGSKRGIGAINKLASHCRRAWLFAADMGLAMGLGLFSYKLLKHRKVAFISGIALVLLIVFFVFPNLGVVLDFIPSISGRVSEAAVTAHASAGAAIDSLALYSMMLLASLIGGFALLTVSLLLFSGASIIYAITTAVSTSNYSTLSNQIPGVFPVIPGITIPLFAGIISLAMLLVAHEFSHGVLARIAKVKIKSVGAVLFGIIPFGAFVEPDEHEVSKRSKEQQNRIFIAGVTANIFLSLFFFVLMLFVVDFVLANISTNGVTVTAVVEGTPASNVLSAGTTLLKWNNYTITNQYALADIESAYKGGVVQLLTSKGMLNIKPLPDGELGILIKPAVTGAAYSFTYFLFSVFALSFALNFFVAIFNLLPMPGFDGWRIYKNEIRSKRVLNALLGIVILAILLNVLPWFWYFSTA
ncbi:MAG: site-2 protease family protein [Candidatus Micrarchaeaceae archaeon]